ncbi:aminotransferase class IV [Thalassobaculum sp. OXR-137]|uniref:aminotransferase class IV n=1 Tax=Thalassobaculum sp. OXR-137 TaxID=3100173 RepID=UPI002AC9C528|nr:aminotransferase class IV [Thalassobaculum sp. OXR-137]WPZ33781.1 aminotransferase class IV [Thalassobaculum sp. OXR-137]
MNDLTAPDARTAADSGADFSKGAAFCNGRYVPAGEASISIMDWGFGKSDVTYDVVHVWGGAFFRLEHHLARFEKSMAGLRMSIPYSREAIAGILTDCVRLSGLREAYVAMIATRGVPLPGMPRRPSLMQNRFYCYAIPWIDVIPTDVQERGAHLIVAKTQRISPESVDPTIKNFHWGDLVRAMFEAEDAGVDNAVLLDADGLVTEGPGFNVFMVKDGTVVSPDRGALEGITRQTVFDLCDALGIAWEIRAITADELRAADEIFTSTTAGGVMPAARIDGTILSNDRPGPISARLKETYWDWHREGRDATPIDYG